MKRISKNELSAAHRIFNRVDRISGGYYGHQTLGQVKEYISENRWVMFPECSFGSLRVGVNMPYPNVFVSFESGEITDDASFSLGPCEYRSDYDGGGRMNEYIGLTYHNTWAMEWLREILDSRAYSGTFIRGLNDLGEDWNVEIQQKIRINYPKAIPSYRTMHPPFNAATVKVKDIQEALIDSDKNLLIKDLDEFKGDPVLGCITVFVVMRKTSFNDFDRDADVAFRLFTKAMSLGRRSLIP